MSNALKFSGDGGKINVIIRFVDDDNESASKVGKSDVFELQDGSKDEYERAGCIRITVADNGVGMTKLQLKSLFRDGVQFSRNKLQGGRGKCRQAKKRLPLGSCC